MVISRLLVLVASIASASAVYQGFNYPSIFTDGSPLVESDYQNEFKTAQNLVGTSDFTSARLYSMIQAGTTNTPTEAIPAAINTQTTLLLGLWASAGQADFNNELAALTSAISTYGNSFTSLIAGIAVGSEDLYRNSPIGIQNQAGVGANPSDIVNYIGQVRSAISGTPAAGALVGHVDTWTAWVNGSNDAVISNSDFIGMDAYPYFQNTEANSIDVSYNLFFQAYDNTVAAAGGKPVWITETGWPVSGPTQNQAVASIQNAQTYWDSVGCAVFGKINTWWYTLRDAYPTTPSPSFGIVGMQLSTTPLFDLSCPADGSSVVSSGSPSSPSSADATSPAASSIVPSVSPTSAGLSASESETATETGAIESTPNQIPTKPTASNTGATGVSPSGSVAVTLSSPPPQHTSSSVAFTGGVASKAMVSSGVTVGLIVILLFHLVNRLF